MTRKIFSLAMAVMLFTVIGCTKKNDTTTNSASLIGTWNQPYSGAYKTIQFKDASNYGFGFSSSGVYSEIVYGTYTTSGNQVSITQTGGSGAGCPGVVGTYSYSISGSTVAFVLVKDTCTQNGGQRSATLTNANFTKQ